jgi:hypothetical protein
MMLLDEHTSKKTNQKVVQKSVCKKPTNPTRQCVHPRMWMIILDEETPKINK